MVTARTRKALSQLVLAASVLLIYNRTFNRREGATTFETVAVFGIAFWAITRGAD